MKAEKVRVRKATGNEMLTFVLMAGKKMLDPKNADLFKHMSVKEREDIKQMYLDSLK